MICYGVLVRSCSFVGVSLCVVCYVVCFSAVCGVRCSLFVVLKSVVGC